MLLLALSLSVLVPQGTDTTMPVRPGARLELSSQQGTIHVSVWNRDAIRVQADHDDDTRVDVDASARTVHVSAHARYGPSEVDWRITIPKAMAVELSSMEGDVEVSGSRGEVSINTTEGNITVTGGVSRITLQSVEGDVTLSDADGKIAVTTVDGTVTIHNATGELEVSATDGDLTLDGVDVSDLDASTVDGDIDFSGPVRQGGRYRLSSHDGNVTVTSPAIDADVSVSTFSGDFDSDYPVTLSGSQYRKRMHFTLGRGGARLDLESFDGTVALRKATARH
jgi:DUF4097 and DUF4098 domain-containing protein YvlB